MTVCLLVAVAALTASGFDLVREGRPVATVVLPSDASQVLKDAAAELATYVGKITGAELATVAEEALPEGPAVLLGSTRAAAESGVSAADLDRDGFLLRALGPRLFIVGHDDEATRLGVCFLLQRYGGVRWYLPTELGEHVPKRATFSVPGNLDDVQEPDWQSRQWSSAARMDPAWERRNLVRARYQFHHNLFKVFVPSELYDEHPEWFPLRSPDAAERYRPTSDDEHGWQPCFANEAAARYAADLIIRRFDEDPAATSFSLGVNDSSGYCQCAQCRALDDPDKPTFRGRPNYSNRFFTFANRVAELVAARHPDKLIGCLAYSLCEEVPSFPVHPNIIPYLTNDRAQWWDAAFRREDEELLRRWSKAARQLGVYDYYYGSGYVIPRLFTRLSDESIKFCRDTGVTAWYAEIYSNWSLDGPKAWLASQLLWDTDQDARALLDDYYANFFGPAAEPMRRYWERCEQVWMAQGGSAHWFKYFFDADQLELFSPEVLRELRGYLTDAERKTVAAQAEPGADGEYLDLVRRRVELYRQGLGITQRYSRVWHLDREIATTPVTDGASARRVAEAAVAMGEALDDLARYREDVIATSPLHAPVIAFEERCRNMPGQGLALGLVAAVDWALAAGKPELVVEVLGTAEHARSVSPTVARLRAWIANPALAEQLLANGGVEDGEEGAEAPTGWGTWIRPGTTANLEWATDRAHGGTRSLRVSDATAACYTASVPVEPGQTLLARAWVSGRVTAPSTVELVVQWQDAEGKWVHWDKRAACGLRPGEHKDWRPLLVLAEVPEGAGRAVLLTVVYNQQAGDVVYFDDLSLVRLPAGDGN